MVFVYFPQIRVRLPDNREFCQPVSVLDIKEVVKMLAGLGSKERNIRVDRFTL